MTLPGGRNGPCAYVGHTCNVHLHVECLRHHPISECPASIPERRRRPGPAPVLLLWSSAGWARSSAGPLLYNPQSSEQLPSIAPRWPHSESLGPGCATPWPAVRRRVTLRSSIAGVACRADGCLPSGGRARSEPVSASCAMVGWALSIGLIDLPFSHWTHVTFKHMVPFKKRKRPPLKDVRHRKSDIVRYRMLTCDIVPAYDVVYDMNLRYRMSCTYDIVGPLRTYNIVYDSDMLK